MQTLLTNEEKYHLLTGRIFTSVARYLTQRLKDRGIDITREQWTILSVLWQRDHIPQQMLADVTGRDKPSTTRLLHNLEKNGYLKRTSTSADKRQNLIVLTSKAREIEEVVNQVVEQALEDLTAGIAESDLMAVRRVFASLYFNISQTEAIKA